MTDEILRLLQLFQPHASDPEMASKVVELAADSRKWPDAHRLFSHVRQRWLETSDTHRRGQYAFEETCLKTLNNETHAIDPFDSDSPYYVIPIALGRARQLGIRDRLVLDIVAS